MANIFPFSPLLCDNISSIIYYVIIFDSIIENKEK